MLKPATREESEALARKYANGRGEESVSLEDVGLAEVALRIVEERAANVATNSASGLPLATSVVEAIALFPAPKPQP